MPSPQLHVSLPLAKRMKELGFPQLTQFYYAQPTPVGTKWLDTNTDEYRLFYCEEVVINYGALAAPCVGQLGEWLPNAIENQNLDLHKDNNNCWWINYFGMGGYLCKATITATNEADARATMLIWLAENGHLDPKLLT